MVSKATSDLVREIASAPLMARMIRCLALPDGGDADPALHGGVGAVGDHVQGTQEDFERRDFLPGQPSGNFFRRHMEEPPPPRPAAAGVLRLPEGLYAAGRLCQAPVV